MPQGLKPNLFPAFTARLKSCPDTKRQELLAQLSLIYPGPSDGTAEREKAYLSGLKAQSLSFRYGPTKVVP
jgi:hypothetical protein